MTSSRPHFDDLNRRYREADWVSEYQRLWAIFNHWLSAHTGEAIDRDCINTLKNDVKLKAWVEDVIHRSAYNRPDHISDGYGGSYPRFAADNEISRFFRAAQRSTILEPRINWPWRAGTERRVKPTNTITLTSDQFRAAYDVHAEVLDSEQGIVYNETLHQIFPALGVGTTGCCFYRVEVPQNVTRSTKALSNMTLDGFRQVRDLESLVSMIDSTIFTSLEADIIETLYNLRNVAMHGSLDFLDEKDNEAARGGYDLLDSLIRNIRDRW